MVKRKAAKKRSVYEIEKRTVDRMMGMVAFIGPASASPQVIEIFSRQSAQGVSLLSWIMYLMLGMVSLSYGLFHHLKPIIVSQILWAVMDVMVITGILMYSRGIRIALSFDSMLVLNDLGKLLTILSFACGAAAVGFYLKAKRLNQA